MPRINPRVLRSGKEVLVVVNSKTAQEILDSQYGFWQHIDVVLTAW